MPDAYALAEDLAAGAFLLCLLLVFRLDIRDHFALPKAVVLQAGTALLWCFMAVRCVRGGCRRPARLIAPLLVALALWWGVSTLRAVHVASALWGNYGRYHGLGTQLALLALFAVFAWRPPDAIRVRRIFALFVLATVPVALYAIAQYVGIDPVPWLKSDNRSASTMGQPVLLGATLAMAMPPALALAILSRGAVRAGWSLLAALAVCGTLAALSRGPLAGLACAMLLFALLAYPAVAAGARGRVLLAAGVLLALATVGVVTFGRLPQVARLASSAGIRQRLVFFQAAGRIVADNPIDGVGLGNFSVVYPRYRSPEDNLYGNDQLPTMAHNGYLQTALSGGLPALALYLGLVALVVAGLVQTVTGSSRVEERVVPAVLVASLASFLVQDLSGWFDPGPASVFWALLGLGASFLPAAGAVRPLPSWVRVAAGGVVPIGLLVVAGHSLRIMEADRLFFDASRLDVGAHSREIGALLSAGLVHARGDSHFSESAGMKYLEIYGATNDPTAYREAADLFARSLAENPHNPYPHLNRIRLETLAVRRGAVGAEPPDVAAAFARLPAMDPNNASVYVVLAEYRIARSDPSSAVALLERAAALRPPDARETNLRADACRSLGRLREAESLFRKGIKLGASMGRPDDWVAATYGLAMTLSASGKHERAVAAVRRVLLKFPDRVYSYNVLAAVYQAKGDTEKARAALARYRAAVVGAGR